jgi:alpha-N-arabinofuranosidase
MAWTRNFSVTGLVVLSLTLLFYVVGSAEVQATGSNPDNLMPNPSFKQVANGKPVDWRTHTWGGQAEFEYTDAGRSGHCVLVASKEGADAAWTAPVNIEPFAKYRLTGWIKTDGVVAKSGKGALINLHEIQPLQTRMVTGDNDWTQVELVFDAGPRDSVQVNCLLGGWGLVTGRAWFDDLSLEQISRRNFKPAIEIDATEIGEPVSKYIYGQFIEHLGRCIYGGIWAEMLQDRKFFYPVGAKESPWSIIGEKNAVKMRKEKPFVGEHTPQVRVAWGGTRCGIQQDGLGLIEGKTYTGYIILAGTGSPEVQVALVWGPESNERATISIDSLTRKYAKTTLRFTCGADTENGRLEIIGGGGGSFQVATVSLMPADNIKGMRADTLELLKELDSPVYRWPGGNFVSGYNWRLGIGPRDERPPMRNPAWRGLEHNDFGLDEFIVFCREIDAEPMIAVNSGFGDAHSAAQEVEYANGSVNTPMGRWRAANGHPEPYHVKWWCIGNEMYGRWQLGHMSLQHYVRKHNRFAKAMRKVDPSIKLIAVGNVGDWSQGMLKNCADYIDLISEHFYRGAKESVVQHVHQAPEAVRHIVSAHRRYRTELGALKGKDIRIAIDEWNYWYGEHLFGELGTRYFMRDALGIACGLHEMIRNSDLVFMAHYAQTVNVIGAIKTTKTDAAFETTGLVLKLYRHRFGVLPVTVTGDIEPLDVVAAWTDDRKALTVAVVNPMEKAHELALDCKNAKVAGNARLWQIAHADPMAYNEPGKEPNVVIEEQRLNISDKLEVPPFSISLYELPVR